MLYIIFYDIPNSIFEELLQETPKDKNIEAKQTEVLPNLQNHCFDE